MTQLVNSQGKVIDLAYLENSSDPSERAHAQTLIAMDKWARSSGLGSYDMPPGADAATANKYIQAQLTFYDQAQRSLGLPTRAEQVVTQVMVSSGDVTRNADGTYTLSAAAAADQALGIGRNYAAEAASASIDAAEAAAAASQILSTAIVPAGVGALVSSLLDQNPDVAARLTPAPGAGGAGAVATAVQADATPPGAQTMAPAATSPAAAVTAADASAILGDEQRTRKLLAYLGLGALLVYLWRR